MKKIFIIFIVIMSIGCSEMKKNIYIENRNLSSEIKLAIKSSTVLVGMTRDDVEASIGRYDYCANDNECEYMYYGYSIIFKDLIVSDIKRKDDKLVEALQGGFVIPLMSKQEVTYVLGAPTSTSFEIKEGNQYDYWIYWIRRTPFWKVTFKNGQVISIIDQDMVKEKNP